MLMTVFRRRRMVTFRLADEEYDALLRACDAQGAHSISEFARVAVLQMLETSLQGASTNQALRRIERTLQVMHEEIAILGGRRVAGSVDRALLTSFKDTE
jgi:hypothetical protein